MVLFSNLFFSFFKNWPGVEILNDQYFEIPKLPMLKVTGGPVIRFFYLRNNFFIFYLFQII